MRRILSVLLAVVLVIGLANTAFAYDEEITFQDIPWGSSIEDTIKIMVEKGFIQEETIQAIGGPDNVINYMYVSDGEADYLYKKGKDIIFGNESDDQVRAMGSCIFDNPLSSGLAKKIAGYNVNNIEFYFAKNDTGSGLISARIDLVFDRKETKEVFDDLTQKLTTVYGKPQKGKRSMLSGTKAPYYAWKGKNDTCVWLFADSLGGVLLTYGTLNAGNILKEYLTAVPTKVPVDSSDTSGL